MPSKWFGAWLGSSGAEKLEPCPGFARNVNASASMISISMPPKMAVVRIEIRMPKWVSTQTIANVISAKTHHGMFTLAAIWKVLAAR